MKILVLNCGSSSLKYQLIDMENEDVLASGRYERIGEIASLSISIPKNFNLSHKISLVSFPLSPVPAVNVITSTPFIATTHLAI